MEPREDPPLVAKLRSLLNRSTRIVITDGRLFVGQFMCIDHSKNIILSGAYESRPKAPSSSSSTHRSQVASPTLQSRPSATTSSEDPGAASLKSILRNKKEEAGKPQQRFVGLVMIPGQHIVKAEMDFSHLRGADSRIKTPTYNLDYLRG
ncbi:hypothetical protein BGZ70_004121 [Mortierella alpina]|uniref:Sm domain-containing protein n=1 Tax=Mortierella alpina TaxID=64518 RepID=A0A9P6LVU2_MORAP|nr:hypothetical protein BGZ70_004121 [Mortierella alpina]